MKDPMDLYLKMGDELRDLFKDLFHPEKRALIKSKMEDILKTASQIGGGVAKEAAALHNDVIQYLEHPSDRNAIAILKNHAMRLENETREI